jgi:hypothetical protein
MLMELVIETHVSKDDWSKPELEQFLALVVEGKGRHEIAEIMKLPFSEVVRAALKYSIVLPA